MSRITTALLGVTLVFAATACLSGEPEVSVREQLPAEAREASERAAQGGEGEDGGDGQDSGGQQLTFVAVDIDFQDAPSEAPAGELTIELVNEGAIEHNVAIEQVGEEPIVEADGGETATGNVELEPGDYTFFCSVPGHRGAGMEGTLTVTG